MDNRPPPSIQPKRSAYFYSQVQAFLDAAEEVDIDEDTIEDILDGLDPDTELEANDKPEVSGNISEHDNDESELSELESEVSYSAPQGWDTSHSIHHDLHYFWSDEAVWKPQQIQGMLRHLKEHGTYQSIVKYYCKSMLDTMSLALGLGSWLQEYVITRQIPIPKLLLVFGVDLVSI
jgi:hypothetical protein